MKNVLLASTALVAFTGAAAADVALSGRAEMGIFQSTTSAGGAPAVEAELQFFTDIDVTFTMSGETDGGLSFGASVDLDEGGSGAAAVANNADDGGATIFISGSFGTVTMGDTDGALDWALTEAGNVGNPGSLADDETSHAGYNGSYLDGNGGSGTNDGQILRWDYSMGAFGVAISAEQNNNGTTTAPTDTGDIGFAVGLKYTADLGGTAVKFGVGYQDNGNNSDVVGISVDASLGNGLSAGVVYSDWDVEGVANDHFGIGLGYSTGALSLHANYGEFDSGNDGFGIAAAYDLGGGAVVHLGYGNGTDTGVDEDSMSFGLGLSF